MDRKVAAQGRRGQHRADEDKIGEIHVFFWVCVCVFIFLWVHHHPLRKKKIMEVRKKLEHITNVYLNMMG